MKKIYKSQVALVLDTLPEIAKEGGLALHGGTAINLFVRDMQTYSVTRKKYRLYISVL